MTDENDGFEKTGWLSQALEIDRARSHIIDFAPTPMLLSITREREVVFYGPDGAETWRCSFDDLSAALRSLVEYPPTIVGDDDAVVDR